MSALQVVGLVILVHMIEALILGAWILFLDERSTRQELENRRRALEESERVKEIVVADFYRRTWERRSC